MSYDRPTDEAAAGRPDPAVDGTDPGPTGQPDPAPEQAERAAKIDWCRAEWARARVADGTPGARYWTEERGLALLLPASVRYLPDFRLTPEAPPRPCLLAAVTDPAGELVALHAVELDPVTGRKSTRTGQPKRSYGPVGEGTVRLSMDPTSSVLVVGEGLETTMTRVLLGPCEAHACVGPLRHVELGQQHRRVELLADRAAEQAARQLAKRYAAGGKVQARVVTVPDSLGSKGDLNDLLRQQGRRAVEVAVEDAEIYDARAGGGRTSEYDLKIGSDIEIAQQTLDKVEELYGVVVSSTTWSGDSTGPTGWPCRRTV